MKGIILGVMDELVTLTEQVPSVTESPYFEPFN